MTATETFRTASILVVEDAPDVLNVLERTLSDNGYSVSTAGDGEGDSLRHSIGGPTS